MVLGEEGGVGSGGSGGGESGCGGLGVGGEEVCEAVGEEGEAAFYDGAQEGEEGAGGCGGDVWLEAGEECFLLSGFVGLAEDGVGGPQEGGELGLQLGVMGVELAHASGEDGEGGDLTPGRGFAGMVSPEGGIEAWYEGVYLVVGSARVGGELEYAYVAGADVVDDGAETACCPEYDVSGSALGVWHVVACEAGEVAFDYLYEVSCLEVDVGEVEEWELVVVGEGDGAEGVHVGIGDGGVPVVGVGGVDDK